MWTLVLLGQSLCIGVALVGVHRSGLRIVRLPAWLPPKCRGTRPTSQFSLAYLMAWIGCVALVLGTLQACGMFGRIHVRWPICMDAVVFLGIAQAVIVAFCVYAVFGETLSLRRALPITTLFLLVLLVGVNGRIPYPPLADILIMFLSFCVLRGVGIRMGRLA